MKTRINGMETKLVTITPKMAEKWIEEMEQAIVEGKIRQRPIRQNQIIKFAQDMRHGKWVPTHQGIAFYDDGILFDGQNRLRAIVLANVSVKMAVTTGMPREINGVPVMDTVDLGAPRTIWQALRISHGYESEAREMEAAARNIVKMVFSSPLSNIPVQTPISTSGVLTVLEGYGYKDSVAKFATLVPKLRFRPAALTALWSWYHKVHPKRAEQLARDYETRANLGPDHPALALDRYISTSERRRRARSPELYGMIANAIRAFHSGASMTVLKYSADAHSWLVQLNWPEVERIAKLVMNEKMIQPAELVEA